MKIKPLIICTISGLLLLSGCGKKAMMRKYYILALTLPSADSTQTEIRLSHQVDVRDFTVAKPIDQTRIALRTDSNEMNYYFYHHWAVKPGTSVADMVYAYFSDSKTFSRLTRGYTSTPQFVISGVVGHMERLEEDKKVWAHLSITMELLDMTTHSPLVTHRFDRELPVSPPKSMNAFAKQVSRILQEECHIFRQKIIDNMAP